MASFRTGFKIFGEISLKQGLGRIRSFSEDRKPGKWLPEDQWAVRQPGTTCPDPCEKPKKPAKPSKSWLSLCKDPEPPIECDVRHNNCPPPPAKGDAPWYSLDNLMPTKKKHEKTPPLQSCKEEMKRREMLGEEEEVCENIVCKTFPEQNKTESDQCCVPVREPCPAPVVTISCPLPKELDLMLWCGKPCTDTSRIAVKCQSDKLPYQEFRPQKCWKPPPFSLPLKGDPTAYSNPCCLGPIAYAEFKQVDVPKPLYTRYKSVKMAEGSLSFCMADVKCPEDDAAQPSPAAPSPLSLPSQLEPQKPEQQKQSCPEKPVLESASCKPVRIQKATKYTFRPKPTKLIEKRVYKNPCAQHKTCNLNFRPPEEKKSDDSCKKTSDCEPPKVITGTLTDEPQTFDRNLALACSPPRWMYFLCKPGAKQSPLVPADAECPKEPTDWCSETDGLKFYDGNDGGIRPKPLPDPCKPKPPSPEVKTPDSDPKPLFPPPPAPVFRNRFVLMPDQYNIKNMRPDKPLVESPDSYSFEKFLEAKTSSQKQSSKSYPPIKENILYDLQRLCPNLPIDRSKLNSRCLKPPEPECPRPPTFCRGFATLTSSKLPKHRSSRFLAAPTRSECGDTSGKCKPRDMTPKPRDCPPEKQKPTCADIALPCCPKVRLPPACEAKRPIPPCKKKLPPKPSFSECSRDPPPCPKMTECNCWEKVGGKNRKFSDWAAKRDEFIFQTNSRNSRSSKYPNKSQYAGKVKCYTLRSVHNSANSSGNRLMLGLKDPKVDSCCEYEPRPVVTKHKKPKLDFQNGDPLLSSRPRLKRSMEPSRTEGVDAAEDTQMGFKPSALATSNKDFVSSPNIMIGQGTEQTAKGEKRTEESKERERESSVTFSPSPEQNDENSKDFMGSIGSWINDLFSVPNKKLCTEQKLSKVEVQKEQSLEEDPEYLKSVSAIKEQFRKKLKNETSVHLSTSERPFEYHFYKVLNNDNRKSRKVMKSIPSSKSTEILEELNNLNYEKLDQLTEKANRNQQSPSALNFRPNQKENMAELLNNASLMSGSALVKKKAVSRRSRSESNKLEEYVLPSAAELSKRILLNINDQDKCLQFYKNSQIGVQESQHYNPRKTKPCQSSTRCYTTNANIPDPQENPRSKAFVAPNRHASCFTGDALEVKGEEDFLPGNKGTPELKKFAYRKTSAKSSPEPTKDVLSLVKPKHGKAVYNPNSEFLRNELKASSDELVKYLMKKVKVSTRPQQKKKTSISMPPVVNNSKNRFMQSATNSLVMSVMAKKENELRLPNESNLTKVPLTGKEVMIGNIRFDVSRALNRNKFNKTSYLLENDRLDEDTFLFEKDKYKSTKRLNNSPKKAEDVSKRQDIKHMLSKLDMKFNVLNATKLKPSKKSRHEKNVFEDLEQEDGKDLSNPRFLKQHERFRSNMKTVRNNAEAVPEDGDHQEETRNEEPPQTTTALSTEVALVNTDVQMTLANLREKNVVVTEQPMQLSSDAEDLEERPTKVTDLLPLVDGVSEDTEKRSEKKSPLKTTFSRDRFKLKTHKFLKESESKSVLDPLQKFYPSELQSQKEPQICPPDLRPVKTLEKLSLNRRYSTNTLTSIRKTKPPTLSWHPVKCYKSTGDARKDSEGEKRQRKEKEKVNSPKKNIATESQCGFEKIVKKPGPNCENEEKRKP